MSIGLFDGDLSQYRTCSFNLELMKLATYYKKRGEIVALTTSLAPQKYSKMFYRKDYYDGFFPSEIETEPNLIYGGYAFTNGIYRPLDMKIEKAAPSPSIYSKYEDLICFTTEEKRQFKKSLVSEHIRLSLDGQSIWEDWPLQITKATKGRTVTLHDFNLNDIKDSDIVVKEALDYIQKGESKCYVATKFPIQVDNEKDFLKWIEMPGSDGAYFIQYNGIMSDETVATFAGRKDRNYSKHILYNIFDGYQGEEDFYKNRLPKIVKQVIFLRMNLMKFSLIYDDDFFISKEWLQLVEVLNNYGAQGLKWTEKIPKELFLKGTISKFIGSFGEKTPRPEQFLTKRDGLLMLSFIQEKNPDLFYDLLNCRTVELQGGKFCEKS